MHLSQKNVFQPYRYKGCGPKKIMEKMPVSSMIQDLYILCCFSSIFVFHFFMPFRFHES